jgi:hypothetical protein
VVWTDSDKLVHEELLSLDEMFADGENLAKKTAEQLLVPARRIARPRTHTHTYTHTHAHTHAHMHTRYNAPHVPHVHGICVHCMHCRKHSREHLRGSVSAKPSWKSLHVTARTYIK